MRIGKIVMSVFLIGALGAPVFAREAPTKATPSGKSMVAARTELTARHQTLAASVARLQSSGSYGETHERVNVAYATHEYNSLAKHLEAPAAVKTELLGRFAAEKLGVVGFTPKKGMNLILGKSKGSITRDYNVQSPKIEMRPGSNGDAIVASLVVKAAKNPAYNALLSKVMRDPAAMAKLMRDGRAEEVLLQQVADKEDRNGKGVLVASNMTARVELYRDLTHALTEGVQRYVSPAAIAAKVRSGKPLAREDASVMLGKLSSAIEYERELASRPAPTSTYKLVKTDPLPAVRAYHNWLVNLSDDFRSKFPDPAMPVNPIAQRAWIREADQHTQGIQIAKEQTQAHYGVSLNEAQTAVDNNRMIEHVVEVPAAKPFERPAAQQAMASLFKRAYGDENYKAALTAAMKSPEGLAKMLVAGHKAASQRSQTGPARLYRDLAPLLDTDANPGFADATKAKRNRAVIDKLVSISLGE